MIAFWLEQKLGKDEILTRYLNNIYLGGRRDRHAGRRPHLFR